MMNCPNCNKPILDNNHICDCGVVLYYYPGNNGSVCYCAHLAITMGRVKYLLEWGLSLKEIRCFAYTDRYSNVCNLPLLTNWNADKLAKCLILI
jgi:hypothetical protein